MHGCKCQQCVFYAVPAEYGKRFLDRYSPVKQGLPQMLDHLKGLGVGQCLPCPGRIPSPHKHTVWSMRRPLSHPVGKSVRKRAKGNFGMQQETTIRALFASDVHFNGVHHLKISSIFFSPGHYSLNFFALPSRNCFIRSLASGVSRDMAAIRLSIISADSWEASVIRGRMCI